MPRLLFSDEHGSTLREMLLQEAICNKRDPRMTVKGMLYRMRTGCPWRALPKAVGSWSSIYKRFNAWSASGKWLKFFRRWWLNRTLIDGRYAKAHQHSAASGKDEGIGKTRAGNSSKIHLAVDASGLPIVFEVTAGQSNDCTQNRQGVQR